MIPVEDASVLETGGWGERDSAGGREEGGGFRTRFLVLALVYHRFSLDHKTLRPTRRVVCVAIFSVRSGVIGHVSVEQPLRGAASRLRDGSDQLGVRLLWI